MILEEISDDLMRVLEIYKKNNPALQIVIPPPGTEDEELKKAQNSDTRIKEIIKLTILIRAIYLPFEIYIKNIEKFNFSRWIATNPLQDMLNAEIEKVRLKQKKIREAVINLFNQYPKTERDRLILNYAYAKHNFCYAYQKQQYNCHSYYDSYSFEKDYGGFTLAEQYSRQNLPKPPESLEYLDEINYLEIARNLYEQRTKDLKLVSMNKLLPVKNDLHEKLQEIEEEIIAQKSRSGLGKESSSKSGRLSPPRP